MIADLGQLYGEVKKLIDDLQEMGEYQWADAFSRDLYGSTSGEILSDLRQTAIQFLSTTVCEKLEMQPLMVDVLHFVRLTLQPVSQQPPVAWQNEVIGIRRHLRQFAEELVHWQQRTKASQLEHVSEIEMPYDFLQQAYRFVVDTQSKGEGLPDSIEEELDSILYEINATCARGNLPIPRIVQDMSVFQQQERDIYTGLDYVCSRLAMLRRGGWASILDRVRFGAGGAEGLSLLHTCLSILTHTNAMDHFNLKQHVEELLRRVENALVSRGVSIPLPITESALPITASLNRIIMQVDSLASRLVLDHSDYEG